MSEAAPSRKQGPATETKVNGRKTNPYLFKPGNLANPKGRPVGSLSIQTKFMNALKTIEKKESKDFFESVIERGYKKDPIAMKLLDKLLPNAGERDDGAGSGPSLQIIVIRSGEQVLAPGPVIDAEPNGNGSYAVKRA